MYDHHKIKEGSFTKGTFRGSKPYTIGCLKPLSKVEKMGRPGSIG
jgi:hypothetical protein